MARARRGPITNGGVDWLRGGSLLSEGQDRRDRRARTIIYVALVAVVAVGLLFPLALKELLSHEAKVSYDLVQGLPEGRRVVVLSGTAGTDGQRQLGLLLGHVLSRRAQVMVISSDAAAAAATESQVRGALAARRLRYGEAMVHLGARDGGYEWVESAARGLSAAASGYDHAGDELALHPLTHRFRTFDDADLLVGIADNGLVTAHDMYRLASFYGLRALLAVSGAAVDEGQALWAEGRIEAVIPGPLATGDYDGLIAGRGGASRYYTAMTLGTLFIVALILWAYIGGASSRRRRAGNGGYQRG